jgi:hypothetical protein
MEATRFGALYRAGTLTAVEDGPHLLPSISMEQAGGLAALLLALGYIVTMPVFTAVGTPPTGAEAQLGYFARSAEPWWVIVGLSVLTDLLFIPVAIGLYRALRGRSDGAMMVAAAFTLLFVVLDLAITWTSYASMLVLGQQYAAAPTADQRAIIVAAASYPDAVLSSPLTSVYSVLTLGIGILVAGFVIFRGGAGRATGVVGVATGLLGIASTIHVVLSGSFSPLLVVVSLLTILWLLMVGRDLLLRRWSSNRSDAGRRAPARAG